MVYGCSLGTNWWGPGQANSPWEVWESQDLERKHYRVGPLGSHLSRGSWHPALGSPHPAPPMEPSSDRLGDGDRGERLKLIKGTNRVGPEAGVPGWFLGGGCCQLLHQHNLPLSGTSQCIQKAPTFMLLSLHGPPGWWV